MSDPISLSAVRWKKDENPNSYTPRDVLAEALRQIDAGEMLADHVIIFHAFPSKDDPTRFTVGYWQGGSFSVLQTMGMVARGLHILNDDED